MNCHSFNISFLLSLCSQTNEVCFVHIHMPIKLRKANNYIILVVAYNPCKSSPCMNWGICNNLAGRRYMCICAGTYEGTNCEGDSFVEYTITG